MARNKGFNQMKEHYYHNDGRWKVAQAYREQAEKLEAERILRELSKKLDRLDPVEDYSDFTDPR